jgi:hypothetical protein
MERVKPPTEAGRLGQLGEVTTRTAEDHGRLRADRGAERHDELALHGDVGGERLHHEVAVGVPGRVGASAHHGQVVLLQQFDELGGQQYGVGALVHGLLDVVVDGHFDAVQSLDDGIESLEDELFDEDGPKRGLQRRTFRYRKDLVELRRVVLPMREVVSAIGAEVKSPWTFLNPWRYFRVNQAATSSLRISEGTGPVALARFGLAMTRVNGTDGLTCGMPIADQEVNWDRERALALLTYVKEDRTGDIPKRLCTPTGLPGTN